MAPSSLAVSARASRPGASGLVCGLYRRLVGHHSGPFDVLDLTRHLRSSAEGIIVWAAARAFPVSGRP